MKRSSIVIILILLLLVGFSVYVYNVKTGMSTVQDEGRNFSFKDTAAITKIFLADKEGNQCVVERTKAGWVVNNKYNCRTDAILNLLEVIKNVEVKMPVPKEARTNVLKIMATSAIKVEVYVGEERVKQYFVGHETPDSESSYMLLADEESGKNYPEPYACFIPGFVGYLLPRYIAVENEWRDRVALNYIPPEMKQLKVDYPGAPDSSFTIDLISTTAFSLKRGGVDMAFDNERMKQYLIYFQNVSYEVLLTGKNKRLEDSLSLHVPFCILSVTTTHYTTDVFKCYRKQPRPDVNPDQGTHYVYDMDRFYLRFAGDREWALAQYFVFGKLFVTPPYFGAPGTVKK